MKVYSVLTLFIIYNIYSLTSGIKLFIHSNGKYVSLKPQTGEKDELIETRWDLETNNGAKIVAACWFKTTKCTKAVIKIYTGEEFLEICPEYNSDFKNVSIDRTMSITIDNLGKSMNAKCDVRATIPFLNVPDAPPVDSSEFGIEGRANKMKPTCRCGWSNKKGRRIVGGNEAAIHEFPFVVLIRHQTYGSFCGGSIITRRHVLTAGHCVYLRQYDPLQIVAGEHDVRTRKESKDVQIINVRKVKVHSEHDEFGKNDIALLELEKNIEFNDKVGPICMPKLEKDLVGQYIKVMGWGKTQDASIGGHSSPILMKVDIRVIDPEVCNVIYDINPTKQICTYSSKKDSCAGDSGGPLVVVNPETNMYQQVAIVSFGRKCASTDPSVDITVASYLGWIQKHIKLKGDIELCY